MNFFVFPSPLGRPTPSKTALPILKLPPPFPQHFFFLLLFLPLKPPSLFFHRLHPSLLNLCFVFPLPHIQRFRKILIIFHHYSYHLHSCHLSSLSRSSSSSLFFLFFFFFLF